MGYWVNKSPPKWNRLRIDRDGYYIDFVVLIKEQDSQGNTIYEPLGYTIKEGEQLVQVKAPAANIANPKWNGSEWEDTIS